MGWLIALGVLILLALLPVGVAGSYDEKGTSLKLIAGPVRIRLLPSEKKKTAKAVKKKNKQQESKSEQKKKGGSWKNFLPIVKVAMGFLNDLRRKLRVRRLELSLTMAGEDPCDLALNYGRTQAALSGVIPMLDRFFVIRKRDIQLHCDFDAPETVVLARIDVRITLGRLLVLVMRHGLRIWKEYKNLDNISKGGASK